MAKTDPEAARRQRHKTIRWVVTVFLITVVISGIISLVSDEVMDSSSLPVAFLILLAIVMVGIIFDIIGMAVASADESRFIPWPPGRCGFSGSHPASAQRGAGQLHL